LTLLRCKKTSYLKCKILLNLIHVIPLKLPAISNNEEKNEKNNDENYNGNIEYDKKEIQKVIEKSKIRLEKMAEKV
jgi:hypothetical protein